MNQRILVGNIKMERPFFIKKDSEVLARSYYSV